MLDLGVTAVPKTTEQSRKIPTVASLVYLICLAANSLLVLRTSARLTSSFLLEVKDWMSISPPSIRVLLSLTPMYATKHGNLGLGLP